MWCVCGATEHLCQSNVATIQSLSTGGLAGANPTSTAVWGAVASVCPASAPWACGTATRGRLLSAIAQAPWPLLPLGSPADHHLLLLCSALTSTQHRLKSLQHHFKKKRTQPEPSSPSLTAEEDAGDVLHSPKHASTDEEYESRPKRRSVSIDVAGLPPTGPPSVCDRRPSLEQWHEARRARWAGWKWVTSVAGWHAGSPYGPRANRRHVSRWPWQRQHYQQQQQQQQQKRVAARPVASSGAVFLLFLLAAGTHWKARGPQPQTG